MAAGAARERNLGYWARQAALRYPDRPAIFDWVDGQERCRTHGLLESNLDAVALALAKRLKIGDRVAIGIGNRAEFVETLFGAMRCGVVPVPINLRQGSAQIRHALTDSGCVAAIVEPRANLHLTEIVDELKLPLRITLGEAGGAWLGYADVFAPSEQAFEPPSLPDEHPALQPYTSGSTGVPKGVVLSHEGQVWWTEAYGKLYKPASDEVSLVAVPLYHKNAMAGAVKAKLPAGAAIVVMPEFEPRRFLENLARFRCTHTTGVPTIYSLALRETDLIDTLDFSSLRSVTVGSAPVHSELRRAMELAFRCPVHESYGLTEGGPVMFGPPLDGRKEPEGSCGVLWPGCEAKIDTGEGLVTKCGELVVRNPGVMKGYNGLPEMTAQRLKNGWLRTGDLFEVDKDGFWYFRGRTDDMFTCGGENVFPKEVEDTLLQHPAVQEACVVSAVHPTKGNAPVALVVSIDAELSESDLKQFALDHGAAYAHPRRVLFVDALPLNGAGKVDRALVSRNLRDLLIEKRLRDG
jgi:long-chain acyl-CoA synthetase